jgi:hypothetical protein
MIVIMNTMMVISRVSKAIAMQIAIAHPTTHVAGGADPAHPWRAWHMRTCCALDALDV